MFSTKQLFKNSSISLHILRKYTSKPELKTLIQKKMYYGDKFPKILLNKKGKTPSHLYIANETLAQDISKYLHPYLAQSSCDTIMEINPGIGLFTRRLLDNEKLKKLLLVESMDYFMKNLTELCSLHPDRVKVKRGDIVNIDKLFYLDKIDNGSRVEELLNDVLSREWKDEPSIMLFGVVGSTRFFTSLMNAAVFKSGIFSIGRIEMYLVMPPSIYLHLTCNSEISNMIYRSNTMLFQMLFEHRFIACLPRCDFLPTQSEYNNKKQKKLHKILSANHDSLYLVRIVPRQNIYEFVAEEDLAALWYFVKQTCVSRSNRVIQNLENWVPGCGPRLIVNQENPVRTVPLYADEDETKLPQYSLRCNALNNKDFFSNINIYTQFGDLSPNQMLTLFSKFRQWPEYKESVFLSSYENSMLKLEIAPESSLDDDDLTISDVDEDDEEEDEEEQK